MSDAGAQTQDLQVKDAVCQSFYANEVGVSHEKKIDKINVYIYVCVCVVSEFFLAIIILMGCASRLSSASGLFYL